MCKNVHIYKPVPQDAGDPQKGREKGMMGDTSAAHLTPVGNFMN